MMIGGPYACCQYMSAGTFRLKLCAPGTSSVMSWSFLKLTSFNSK